MGLFKQSSRRTVMTYSGIAIALSFLAGCDSSSSDGDDIGYLKFYNASKTAPAIHLTIDEDLETSETDELEITYTAIEYGEALNIAEISPDNYFFELAWQDGDSTERSELELIYEDALTIQKDTMSLVVLSDDIQTPFTQVLEIPIIDDDDDDVYDLFNVRVLNMYPSGDAVDIYISEDDQTFNEAELIGSYVYRELSDNHKFDQGSYVFYLTAEGSDEVIFTSDSIDYSYSSQYIMAIRENDGAGSSPYSIDRISNSSITHYDDINAQASVSFYNAVATTDYLEEYSGTADIYLNGVDDSPEFSTLNFGELSNALTVEHGDFSVDMNDSSNGSTILSNHLLSLPTNSNKTVFIFSDEQHVDEDGDGNVDEDGDGVVDEIELNVYTLVAENSGSSSIYSHDVNIINLVDNEDFTSVTTYFVRSNETIETATYKKTVGFPGQDDITLNNNTYQVYVIAEESGSEIILTSFELILDEESVDQFLVIENSTGSATGYKATILNQPGLTEADTDDE
ncbi:hypothetical protein ACFSJY_05360 [Thalassotalea euphylliae]|uniref:hypothetical protein n=1 Tax=Thalassotalea euphylliae TaxID=1655234 RepID=UPI003624BCEC